MRQDDPLSTAPDEIRSRIVKARLQASGAATTQHRQLYEGMANYWEEVLSDVESAGPAE